MGLKKFLKAFFLATVLLLGLVINCHAAKEVVIHSSTYSAGKPSKKNSGGSLGVVKGTILGYKTNYDGQISEIKILVACGQKAGVEIFLDSSSGTLVGSASIDTGSTAWKKQTLSVPVKEDISGAHTLYFKWANTLDFIEFSATVTEGGDNYAKFEETDKFSDIAESPARTEINLLAELGIVEARIDDKFDGNVLATKRDFIRALSMFYNGGVSGMSDQQFFKDVDKTDADYNKIAWLCATGVLEANIGAELKAEGAISVQEASGMLCRLLGYEYKNKAGANYITIAQRLGILKNVSNVTAKSMKRIDMAWLLYNTLESKFDEIEGIRYDGVATYVTDKNILKMTNGVYLGKGIVSASDSANLYSAASCAPQGTVEIDGEIYICDKTMAANYIGFNCIFFYEEDEGQKTLLAIRPHKRTQYKLLNSKDTEFAAFESDKLSYFDEDGDEEEFVIDPSTVIMYNGRPSGDSLKELLGSVEDFCGEILMIDNDNDDNYETIFIEQAVSMIFGGAGDDVIYDFLTGATVKVGDTDDVKLFYGIISCDWRNIPVGTVIDVYRSKNSMGDILTRIYATDDAVTGVVKEINTDAGVVFEDGTAIKAYKTTVKDPGVGMTVNLKLNSYGCYIDYDTEIGEKIGLVIRSGQVGKGTALNKTYGVRILSEENEVVELIFANKVYGDGVLCNEDEELYNGKNSFEGISVLNENDVIRYSLNTDGKIFMIDTAKPGAGGTKDTLAKLAEEASLNIRGTMMTDTNLLEVCPLAAGYKVIQVDPAAGEYGHQFRGTFAASDSARKLTPYTTKGDSVAADLLVWNYTRTNATGEHFIVQKKTTAINENGEEEIVLKGISSSGEVSYTVDANIYGVVSDVRATVDAILPGDLVQTALTAKDKVSLVSVRYMRDAEESRTNASGKVQPSMSASKYMMDRTDSIGKHYWCKIIGREDNILIAERINAKDEREEFYIDCSNVKVITVDKENDYKATLDGNDTSRLTVGTKIVACCKTYAYVPYLLVIYR